MSSEQEITRHLEVFRNLFDSLITCLLYTRLQNIQYAILHVYACVHIELIDDFCFALTPNPSRTGHQMLPSMLLSAVAPTKILLAHIYICMR
jgi:hypothetical protein